MISPVQADLLMWLQASIGWAVLAARIAPPALKADMPPPATLDEPARLSDTTSARLRATITIDIDACDPAMLEQVQTEILAQYDRLRQSFPAASLDFRRRRTRTARRAPAPPLIVAPYADD